MTAVERPNNNTATENPCGTLLQEEEKQNWLLIGEGAFAKVYKVAAEAPRNEGESGDTAVKEICFESSLVKYKGWISIPILFREVENWKKIRHKNVVSYHCSRVSGPNSVEILKNIYKAPDLTSTSPIPEINFLLIHMEYCESTLNQWLQNRTPQFPVVEICTQLLTGLQAIHEMNIIHRDLTPANIFLKGSLFKIGDFGLSAEYSDKEEKSAHRGTLLFQSPEICNGSKNYTELTDVYSLGLNFLLLLNHRLINDEFYKKGIFYELREGSAPDSALLDVTKGISQENSVESSIVMKMLERNLTVRFCTNKALQKFIDHSEGALQSLTSKIHLTEKNVNFRTKSCCEGFTGRVKQIEEIYKVLNMNGGNEDARKKTKIISIIGDSSVGKSELAKKIGKRFYENGGSCIWIGGGDDITSNYKHFSNFSSAISAPWLIIFDGIEERSVGYFRYIMKALGKSKIQPNFMIVTSVEKIPDLNTDLVVDLDYSWVQNFITTQQGNLGNLMRLILKSEINSSNTSPDNYHLCTRICEAFSLLTKPTISDVECVFGLVTLIAYMFRRVGQVPKIGFILFWKRFVGLSKVDNILKVFLSTGTLFIAGPEPEPQSESSQLNRVWKFASHLKTYLLGYENTDNWEDQHKYILTKSCNIWSEIISHPMVGFIFKSILKKDTTQLAIFTRLLETFKNLKNEISSIHMLRTNFIFDFYGEIITFDRLCIDFAAEIASFSFDGTVKENQYAYQKFIELFGESDKNTLTIANEVSKDYFINKNYQECLTLSRNVYSNCKLTYGDAHKLTLQVGERFVECLKILGEYKEELEIMKEMASNSERELGLKVSNLRYYNLAKILEKIGEVDEALTIYEKILPTFHYDFFTQQDIANRIEKLKLTNVI